MAISAPHAPAYRTDHRDRVVINSGLLSVTSRHLRFGVSDGFHGDNGGGFEVEIAPLGVQAPVPEPAWAGLLLAGLHLAPRRRQRAAASPA